MNIDMDELEYMLGWGDFPQPKISESTDIPSVEPLSSDVVEPLSSDVYKWVSYSIEERNLNRISTEITLSVVFKNNRKSNVTLPAILI